MTQVVQVAHAEGKALFGGTSNSHYAAPGKRQVVTQQEVNAHGEHLGRLGVGRLVNGHLVVDRWEKTSPVGTEAEVRSWLSQAFAWAKEEWTGSLFGGPAFPLESKSTSVCPKCDHFGTLRVKQEAYGDSTTCATEGCDYSDWYSIGD